MFACGLVTTLNVTVCCNTAIRLESVRCALVACGVKYVRLLATTLIVAVHCHIAIKPKYVCCSLMTCGQVFFCCSAITLGIVVCCGIAIKPEFVHCVLAIIIFLPICHNRLRKILVSAFGLKSARRVPTAISLFPVHCLFVIFQCISSISRSSPKYRVHAATGLSPVCCAHLAIGIPVFCIPAASGLIPVRHRMGIHLSWSALLPMSMDVGLFLRVGSIPSTMGRSGILPGVGSVPLTIGWSVSGDFFEGFRL